MLYLVVIMHDITLYSCHSFVIYVTNVPHLEVLNATAITINYDWFARMGSVEITLIEHVFDSKELNLWYGHLT